MIVDSEEAGVRLFGATENSRNNIKTKINGTPIFKHKIEQIETASIITGHKTKRYSLHYDVFKYFRTTHTHDFEYYVAIEKFLFDWADRSI
jgi:hypothetical protein